MPEADDTRTWIWIGAALALVAAVGAVAYLLGRDAGSAAAPQPAATAPIESGVAGSGRSAGDAAERRSNGGGGAGGGSTAPAAWDGPGHELIGVDRKVEVHSAPGGRTVRRLGRRTQFGGPRVMWVAKRRGAWLGVVAPELGNGRIGWVRNDPRRLRYGTTPYTIRVDLSDRVITVRRAGSLVRRVVVSVGRIGSQTPPGTFAVTDVITRGLDPAYGCCAIALSARQPSLPAGWIGGDRIAIHGWADPVGEAASGGCLRASNGDVRWLSRRIYLGTPVFVSA